MIQIKGERVTHISENIQTDTAVESIDRIGAEMAKGDLGDLNRVLAVGIREAKNTGNADAAMILFSRMKVGKEPDRTYYLAMEDTISATFTYGLTQPQNERNHSNVYLDAAGELSADYLYRSTINHTENDNLVERNKFFKHDLPMAIYHSGGIAGVQYYLSNSTRAINERIPDGSRIKNIYDFEPDFDAMKMFVEEVLDKKKLDKDEINFLTAYRNDNLYCSDKRKFAIACRIWLDPGPYPEGEALHYQVLKKIGDGRNDNFSRKIIHDQVYEMLKRRLEQARTPAELNSIEKAADTVYYPDGPGVSGDFFAKIASLLILSEAYETLGQIEDGDRVMRRAQQLIDNGGLWENIQPQDRKIAGEAIKKWISALIAAGQYDEAEKQLGQIARLPFTVNQLIDIQTAGYIQLALVNKHGEEDKKNDYISRVIRMNVSSAVNNEDRGAGNFNLARYLYVRGLYRNARAIAEEERIPIRGEDQFMLELVKETAAGGRTDEAIKIFNDEFLKKETDPQRRIGIILDFIYMMDSVSLIAGDAAWNRYRKTLKKDMVTKQAWSDEPDYPQPENYLRDTEQRLGSYKDWLENVMVSEKMMVFIIARVKNGREQQIAALIRNIKEVIDQKIRRTHSGISSWVSLHTMDERARPLVHSSNEIFNNIFPATLKRLQAACAAGMLLN